MDSSARLDYALFQLTPTRTRCDLVVFSGSKNEKLASGLVEPFISHLRCAKEQLPKGGYSITLRAPTANSPWFTKGTLERFVRFVSTPEVLERFVTIEREISQIEISIQTNESSNTNIAASTDEGISADANAKKAIVPFKPKGESNGTDEAPQGENSKIRLQRVLETRKVVLRKEQAMAYARAFVAGFEMDYIDDLISFADAFGASRLREACINFKELCNKKHNDGLWMDELAAVQAFTQPELPYLATPGIILAGDGGLSNGQLDPNGSLDASVSDSTTSHASTDINQGQVPPTTATAQGSVPWPNHLPQFMYNFQQMPPYQGYPFPGMQGVPPYYPRNMPWPPNAEETGHDRSEPDNRRNRKSSSRKKEKHRSEKVSDPSEEEQSDTTSGSEIEHEKKHSSVDEPQKKRNGKKSSRTVVIRNINYITSKRKDGDNNGVSDESSSAEDDFIDGTSLKQKVEDAVGSLEKHHKSRRSKTRGGTKNLTVTNDSNGEADQDLEDDAVANTQEGKKTNNPWDSFQNLLMRDDKLGQNEAENQQALDLGDEYSAIKGSELGSAFVKSHDIDPQSENRIKQRMVATDSFVLADRDAGNERNTYLENFESIERVRPNMNKRDSSNEEMLFSHRTEETDRTTHDTLADSTTERSVLKTQRGEDWFLANQPDKSMGRDSTIEYSIFDSDRAITAPKYNKDAFGDDSFMVQSRSVDDQHDSQWRTDISMISDLTVPSQIETNAPDVSADNLKLSSKYEPDDLCMVLERDIGGPTGASWTPEIDYGIDISYKEADKRHSGGETTDVIENNLSSDGKIPNSKNKENPAKKLAGKETKSKTVRAPLWKSKHEIISRPKKTSTASRSTVQKSKAEMEEETRKKMEELLIERQKRIAERSAARGFSPATSKADIESKTPTKQASKQTTQEMKKVITSSTIDRLAAPQVKHKGSSTPSPKSTQPKKPSPKVNGVVATSLLPKDSKDEDKKVLSRTLSSPSSAEEKDQGNAVRTKLQVEPIISQEPHTSDSVATSQDQKELSDPSPTIVKKDQEKISEQLDCVTMEDKNRETSKVTPTIQEEDSKNHGSQINGFAIVKMEDHLPPTPENSLNSTDVNLQEEIGAKNQTVLVSSEISENEIIPDPDESAETPTNGMNSDATHTRKKWSSNEGSPPVTKGLKKLLMFGRKNISAAS